VKPELEKLARHRLSRAKGAFSEGDHLLTAKAFMGAVNRFYYAAFYAARALLAIRELDSSRHSGVISLFQAQFVKPGLIATEKAKALPRAFEQLTYLLFLKMADERTYVQVGKAPPKRQDRRTH
jgi:uncharacterized protein (UPF0332 family)